MRESDREDDEDDEAGAEESDPGDAQDSHALQREADLIVDIEETLKWMTEGHGENAMMQGKSKNVS